MDGSHRKFQVSSLKSRIPIDRKFVPNSEIIQENLSNDADFVPSTGDFVGANIGNFGNTGTVYILAIRTVSS